MEAVRSSETSVNYHTARWHAPENIVLQTAVILVCVTVQELTSIHTSYVDFR
jgi:hypothetical protein